MASQELVKVRALLPFYYDGKCYMSTKQIFYVPKKEIHVLRGFVEVV